MLTLQALIDKLHAHQERLGIEFCPPATEAEVQQLEQALGWPLPPDIAAFYRYCNGFDTYDDLFKLSSIDWILRFSDRLVEQRFEVADYMICTDVWEVVLDPGDPARYRIVNVDRENAEVTLTTSLYDFISRYLDGEDVYALYEWHEEEKRKTQPPSPV